MSRPMGIDNQVFFTGTPLAGPATLSVAFDPTFKPAFDPAAGIPAYSTLDSTNHIWAVSTPFPDHGSVGCVRSARTRGTRAYFRAHCNSLLSTGGYGDLTIGLVPPGYPPSYKPGYAVGSMGYSSSNGYVNMDGSTVAVLAPWGAGDWLGVLYDPVLGIVWVEKNGAWLNGDPVAGTGGYMFAGDEMVTAHAAVGCDIFGVGGMTGDFLTPGPAGSNATAWDDQIAPLTYAWEFGDGGTSTEQFPTHDYATPGTYTVSLVCTYGPANAGYFYAPFVDNRAIDISTSPSTPSVGANAIISNNAFHSRHTVLSDSQITWEGPELGHPLFANPFTIQANVAGYGANATGRIIFEINAVGGSVQMGVFDYANDHLWIGTQTDQINAPNGSGTAGRVALVLNDGPPRLYLDGTKIAEGGTTTLVDAPMSLSIGNPSDQGAEDYSVSALWIAPGALYTGDFTAISPLPTAPASERRVDYVVVSAGLPVVNFSGTPLSGAPPLTVVFTDLSDGHGAGSEDSWLWNFGDGQISVDQNPTHVYAAPGIYTVALTVDFADGSSPNNTKIGYVVVSTVPPPPPPPPSPSLGKAIARPVPKLQVVRVVKVTPEYS